MSAYTKAWNWVKGNKIKATIIILLLIILTIATLGVVGVLSYLAIGKIFAGAAAKKFKANSPQSLLACRVPAAGARCTGAGEGPFCFDMNEAPDRFASRRPSSPVGAGSDVGR